MTRLVILGALLVAAAAAADDWGPAQFLIGDWVGEGGGGPGQGGGAFSLAPDLQGKVLVRKNYAEYPAADGRPATRHEDLMVIYRDQPTGQLRAIYFDSEEHVIQYAVTAADKGVVFTSDGPPTAPRYRLTYTPSGANAVKIKFEVSAPGKDFTAYIEASARRK